MNIREIMDDIISNTLQKYCEIDKRSVGVLVSALKSGLKPYIKVLPSLKSLPYNQIYLDITKCAKVRSCITETMHAVIALYPGYDKELILSYNGELYSSRELYPMYLHLEFFGEDMVLVKLKFDGIPETV